MLSEQFVGDVWIAQLDRKREWSTSEVQPLQKFCRRNCWVFAAPHKSECQLTAKSADFCRTRGSSRLPNTEAPARTLWTWHALGWVANGVRVVPAWCDHDVACQWSVVQWRSAQTAACAVECPANRRAANYNSPADWTPMPQLRTTNLAASAVYRHRLRNHYTETFQCLDFCFALFVGNCSWRHRWRVPTSFTVLFSVTNCYKNIRYNIPLKRVTGN